MPSPFQIILNLFSQRKLFTILQGIHQTQKKEPILTAFGTGTSSLLQQWYQAVRGEKGARWQVNGSGTGTGT